jgi:aminopeptidase N
MKMKKSSTIIASLALAGSLVLPTAVSAKSLPFTMTDIPKDHSSVNVLKTGQTKQTKDNKVLGPANPHYTMNVSYDTNKHQVTGSLSVAFENNLKIDLNELYFNLWGNAAMFTDNGGGMEVSHIKVNGKEASYAVNGTSLHITGVSLKKASHADVSMDFKVTLPNQQDRFGWYKNTVSLGNWFPILSVYDNEGWNIDPYFPYGESFYSLTGDFDVRLTTDKQQIIATSGTEIGEAKIKDNLATHRYKAHEVRDFAIQMDPGYHVKSANVDNIKINVYYTDEQAKYADSMLESGIDSVTLFSDKFGKYPWPELDITGMEGWFGGMEYPQLVMISIPSTSPRSQNWVKSVTSHEIGHQWFYGIIGDNEYDEPWLDESFASFSAALYGGTLDQLTTEPASDPYYHLSSPVSTFTAKANEGGIGNYYGMIYGYGSRTLNDLRLELGDDQFYKSMQAYFKEMKFGVSTTSDFMRIMQETSGKDLSAFFESHRVFASDQQ